jgi:hypothetical protein
MVLRGSPERKETKTMRTFKSINAALTAMNDGEIFSFTFGTLAHYDRVVFVDRIPYVVTPTGKTGYRLYL